MRSEVFSATTSDELSIVEPDSCETDNDCGPSRLPYDGRQLVAAKGVILIFPGWTSSYVAILSDNLKDSVPHAHIGTVEVALSTLLKYLLVT